MTDERTQNETDRSGALGRRRFLQATGGLVAAGALGTNVASAQEASEPSWWSDPATWDGSPPEAGDRVTIEAGDHVVLDTSPPPLDGVLVNGTLEFADDSIVSNDGDSGEGGDSSDSGDDGGDGGNDNDVGDGTDDSEETSDAASCPAPWDSGAVYREGDRATYDGTRWEAQWWTEGDEPGASEFDITFEDNVAHSYSVRPQKQLDG